MNKTTKILSVVALLLTFNAFGDDAAFRSIEYKVISETPLNPIEKTVNFTYPSHPCGTLMQDYTAAGSVRLGRGPVYELMLNQCKKEDSNSYPDDGTVRTFACRNVVKDQAIRGNAVFAFRCIKGPGEASPALVKVPLKKEKGMYLH